MAADTQGKDAQFWADQAANYKAELDALNPALDAAKAAVIAAEAARDGAIKLAQDELTAEKAAFAKEVEILKSKFDLAGSLNTTAQSLAVLAQNVGELSCKL